VLLLELPLAMWLQARHGLAGCVGWPLGLLAMLVMQVFCFAHWWRRVQAGVVPAAGRQPQWPEQPASGRLYHFRAASGIIAARHQESDVAAAGPPVTIAPTLWLGK
jgi:hypothetical protein